MPVDRDPGFEAADILEAPPQARSAPERRWPPADRRNAPPPPPQEPAVAEQKPQSARRRRLRWALFLLLPIGLVVGAYFYFEGGATMTTDDAYVEADQVGLSTDVSGMVKSIEVKDNQHVTAGQVLFRLDPLPFQLKLDQAEAQLGVIARQFQCAQRELPQCPGADNARRRPGGIRSASIPASIGLGARAVRGADGVGPGATQSADGATVAGFAQSAIGRHCRQSRRQPGPPGRAVSGLPPGAGGRATRPRANCATPSSAPPTPAP